MPARGRLTRSVPRGASCVLVQVMLVAWATLAKKLQTFPRARRAARAKVSSKRNLCVFLSRRRWMGPAAIALFFGVVAWWISIPNSHDRPWRLEVAVMTRASDEAKPLSAMN